tara:strand:+ start:36 stop:830 length:795 start_codon:yes stop_codon:yes gene_type:complete
MNTIVKECRTVERIERNAKRFLTKAREVHGDRYCYDSIIYKGARRHVVLSCKHHGKWQVTPDNHIGKKSGCPKCANNVRMTSEEFVSKARAIHGSGYNYNKIGLLKNNKTKVAITCPSHGDFKVSPSNHINHNSGCPSCSGSKGESILRELLEQRFRAEFPKRRPDWNVNPQTGSRLELDCYSEKLKMAFEFNGRQHYVSVEYFGGDEKLVSRKQRDGTKLLTCEANGVKLFTIDGRPCRTMSKEETRNYLDKKLQEIFSNECI